MAPSPCATAWYTQRSPKASTCRHSFAVRPWLPPEPGPRGAALGCPQSRPRGGRGLREAAVSARPQPKTKGKIFENTSRPPPPLPGNKAEANGGVRECGLDLKWLIRKTNHCPRTKRVRVKLPLLPQARSRQDGRRGGRLPRMRCPPVGGRGCRPGMERATVEEAARGLSRRCLELPEGPQ